MRKRLTQDGVGKMRPPIGADRVEIWDTVVPGFGVRVTGRGTKTYFLVTRIHGRKVRRTIARHGAESVAGVSPPIMTLTEAREAARKALEAAERGEDARTSIAAPDTFSALVTMFLKNYAARNTKPRTAEESARLFRNVINPAFGHRRPESIGKRELVTFLSGLAEKTPTQANRAFAALRKLFNWAVGLDLLQASPLKGVEQPAKEQRRQRVLSDAELGALLNAALAVHPVLGAFFEVLALTGQRRTEVAQMRWADLDMRARLWTLPGERHKSGNAHTVPLTRAALRIIGQRPRVDECEYVFTTDGEHPVSGFSKFKAALSEAAGIPADSWRLHDVRRTVGTGLGRLGHPRFITEKVLGHSDRSVTSIYDRYDYDPQKRAALRAWAVHTLHCRARSRREKR